ncbi:hypothetical protein FPZ12_001535 [Amycolatopsis acidicola]|uniref:Uncharacterized protein n=1 Tax=Amycolatopsis acidicola TaxID=2596893 RepID=A0A5N0VKQ5_9PSEU|nr:hypothetical protein [Amycolatopsis acidicola]KAA9166899.1 hypothetical protein FPZ12_001535 [Amycolatopsis acidicola]
MAAQWDPRGRTGHRPGESAVQPSQGIDSQNVLSGRKPYGQPITRVDFFRRMPTGGATAYFKPTQEK